MLLVACSGCSVWDNQANCPEETFEVLFTPGEETKAGTEGAESTVSHLTIILYRESSTTPYAYGSASAGSLALSIASGAYTIYALANDPSFSPSSSTTPSVIASMTSSLTDNSRAALVMSGAVTRNISASGTVAVPVWRHTAKVTLQSVSVDFGETFLKGETVHLRKAYLTNVWGTCSFGSSTSGARPETTVPAESGTWFNLHGYTASSCDDLLYATLTTDIPDGSTSTAKQYFYCTPNPSTVTEGSVTPCCTRLVLEATIGDDSEVFFYHVDLPGMSPNSSYAVSVTIGYLGGSDPETNLSRYSISAGISIEDYTVSETPAIL